MGQKTGPTFSPTFSLVIFYRPRLLSMVISTSVEADPRTRHAPGFLTRRRHRDGRMKALSLCLLYSAVIRYFEMIVEWYM